MRKRIKTTLNEFLSESSNPPLIKGNPDGTCYHDVSINATPNQLIQVIGEPHMCKNDGEGRVNMRWCFEIEKTGITFTIYDWKQNQPLDMDTSYNWHIGGDTENDCLSGLEILIELLKK